MITLPIEFLALGAEGLWDDVSYQLVGFFIVLITLIGLWIFTGCGSKEVQKEEKVRPVKSMIIGDVADPTGKGFPGVTKETQESEISFRVDGPITKLNELTTKLVDIILDAYETCKTQIYSMAIMPIYFVWLFSNGKC